MKILKLIFISAIISIFANVSNAQNVTDIKKIDFENFTHRVGKESIKIKNGLQTGTCAKDADGIPSGDIWNVDKGNIAYGDLNGDGKAEAIVPMIANVCGGNMITNEAILVYTLKSGKAAKLPDFIYHDEPCEKDEECSMSRNPGVTVEYDAAAKAIAVSNYFATEDDAVCCPSFLRKTWFRWDGAKFVELKKGKIEANKLEKL